MRNVKCQLIKRFNCRFFHLYFLFRLVTVVGGVRRVFLGSGDFFGGRGFGLVIEGCCQINPDLRPACVLLCVSLIVHCGCHLSVLRNQRYVFWLLIYIRLLSFSCRRVRWKIWLQFGGVRIQEDSWIDRQIFSEVLGLVSIYHRKYVGFFASIHSRQRAY